MGRSGVIEGARRQSSRQPLDRLAGARAAMAELAGCPQDEVNRMASESASPPANCANWWRKVRARPTCWRSACRRSAFDPTIPCSGDEEGPRTLLLVLRKQARMRARPRRPTRSRRHGRVLPERGGPVRAGGVESTGECAERAAAVTTRWALSSRSCSRYARLGAGAGPARNGAHLRSHALRAMPFARQGERKPAEDRAAVPHAAPALSGRGTGRGAGRRDRHRPSRHAGISAGARSDRRFHRLPEDIAIEDRPAVAVSCLFPSRGTSNRRSLIWRNVAAELVRGRGKQD